MNKKVMLLSAAAIGTFALTLTAVLSSNNIGFLAKATESPYVIADNQYQVTMLEQYNNGGEYGFYDDQPLGSIALGGYILDNKMGTLSNYSTHLHDGINSTFSWRFTTLKVKNAYTEAPYTTTARLETRTATNVLDTSIYDASTDENKIGVLIKGSSTNFSKIGVMMTEDYIDGLDDFSFFYRSVYTRKWGICFQVEGEEWQRLYSSTSTGGNYTGTRGWDSYGYTSFNCSASDKAKFVGKRVKLAIGVANLGTDSGADDGNILLSAILINANKAAVRYLNTLSYKDNICSSNGANLYYDLNKTSADGVHNQDLFHLATERATGEFLANYSLGGTKTKETSALGLYNHLVGAIPGLGDAK